MNKAELKAITMIASKMNWMHKPVCETMETIKKMVCNQQALELNTIGECDDFEETLLSIALWDHDKIVSTLYVSNYESLIMWGVECFCEDMGITTKDFPDLLTWNSVKDNFLAPEYEMEDMAYEEAMCDGHDAEMLREVMWMNHNC